MRLAKWIAAFVALAGLVSGVILGLELLGDDAAFSFSSQIYAPISVGAGLVLVAAAFRREGTERIAWVLVGFSVTLWGMGEAIWVWYSYVSNVEVPYPGWADVSYLAGYPVMFAGLLLMPHVRLMRYERIRLSLDAVAGAIALGAIMWTLYLHRVVYFDPDAGLLERYVNIAYPLADVVLLVALLILAMRRTARRFDPSLLVVALGIAATALADIVYVVQVEDGTYTDGGSLDALWLIGYGCLAAAAYLLYAAPSKRERAPERSRIWYLLAPYTAVIILMAMTLSQYNQSTSVLQLASTVVAVLVIGRQGFAIKENREIVMKQRDDLVASVSHELRTPLTSIRGYSQLLTGRWDRFDDSQRRELVGTIDRQSSYLSRLVTDLVNVARDELDGVALDLADQQLETLVSSALETMGETCQHTNEITADTIPDISVRVDASRIQQILVNLLTNACRYGNGEILVSVSASGSWAHIEVNDNGPGVARKYQAAIWERFERGEHRLDSAVPGSGIGLSVARSLASAHGGTITYEPSNRLGGACFRLSLPMVSEPFTSPAEEPAQVGA